MLRVTCRLESFTNCPFKKTDTRGVQTRVQTVINRLSEVSSESKEDSKSTWKNRNISFLPRVARQVKEPRLTKTP